MMHACGIDEQMDSADQWWELKSNSSTAKAIEAFVEEQYSRVPDFYQAVRYLRATVHGISRSLSAFKRKRPMCEGAMPVSLMRADIAKLYYGDMTYLVAPKSNGTRYQCVFLTVGDEKVMGFRQPQTKKKYIVHASSIPECLFQGTLWDGELIQNECKQWEYHVFGNICTNGTFEALKSFTERMQVVESLFQEWKPNASVIKPEKCPIGLHVKRRFLMKDVLLYQRYVTQCGYKVDGTLFQPNEFCEVTGTHFKLKKFKLPEENTADLLAKKQFGPVPKHLKYATSERIQKDEPYYQLSSAQGPFSYMKAFSEVDGKILEVRWSKKGTWELVKVRTNKRKPNREETVLATLKCVQEALRFSDVFPFLSQSTF